MSNRCQNLRQPFETLVIPRSEGTTKAMMQSLGTGSVQLRRRSCDARAFRMYACTSVRQTVHPRSFSNLWFVENIKTYTLDACIHIHTRLEHMFWYSRQTHTHHAHTCFGDVRQEGYVFYYCSVLQCVAVCCSVLQCVAVTCSTTGRACFPPKTPGFQR